MSFKNIVSDLKVTPYEELDLMIKWLGPESTKHAINIRASHLNNPELHVGLKRVWERLDEKYGAAEMVEESLKRNVENFQTLQR